MGIQLLLSGLLSGFLVALPIGPVGLLCIERTLEKGRVSGLFSGLGIVTADTFYSVVAGLSLTFVNNAILMQHGWLQFCSGLFFCFLGTKIFFKKISQRKILTRGDSLFNFYLSTFFLTLANPTVIFAFIAVFAALGVVKTNANYLSSGVFASTVFIGASAWWVILINVVSTFQKKLEPLRLHKINRILGLVIVGFGLATFLK